MQQWEQPGAGDGEERHRLGEAVDRRAPRLVQEKQDGRDQRPGVTDANPPHEVDDGESPGDGDVDAPDAYALVEQVADGKQQQHDEGEGEAEADPPAARRPRGLHDCADLVGYRAEGVPRADDGRRRERSSVCGFVRHGASRNIDAGYRSNSGFGLRRAAR